jgi:hypothetical protein
MAALTTAWARTKELYQGKARRPLEGYAALLGGYTTMVAAVTSIGRALGVRPPRRWDVGDLALMCVATHKASRLLSKDAVTSPLRAPFTRFEQAAGQGEVNESVRGQGARHVAGEMLSCPFSLGVWVATGMTAAMVFAPRATRLAATTLTVATVSDLLQIGYDGSKQLLQWSARDTTND